MRRLLAMASVGGLLAVATLVGCGPVQVRDREALARPPVVHEAKVIAFELEQSRIPSRTPSAERGREVYSRRLADGRSCVSCHGADGQPRVAGAPDFREPTWVRDQRPPAVQAFIDHGEGHAFHDLLTLQEQWDLVAYTRFLATSTGEIRATRDQVFGLNCNVCHGNKGFGNGFLAPTMQPLPRNLTDYQKWGMQRTDSEIFESIYYGVHWSGMPPWRGTLSEKDVWRLVDFIRASQYEIPEND